LTAVPTLGASPFQIGALRAAQSSPYLLLSPFAGVWVDRLRRRPILLARELALGPAVIGALGAAVRAAGGLAFAVLLANTAALQQALVPAAMQGRANGCLQFVYASTVPFGALAGGPLAERAGLRTGLAVAVLGFAATTLLRVLSTVRYVRHLPARGP
jgi:MFS family permease